MSFSVGKEDLIRFVSACQERSYCEEIDLLQQKGDNIDWVVRGVGSDIKGGIPNEEKSLQERRDFYGNNQKVIKEPPGIL